MSEDEQPIEGEPSPRGVPGEADEVRGALGRVRTDAGYGPE
ncbi:hypothetical protein ACH4E8_26925 [Streptomyces sp. NPDC017979]